MSNRAPKSLPAGIRTAGLVAADRRRGSDRRRLSVRTFVQGGFVPRRRTGRRASDASFLVDWHEPHLMFLAITILLLSVTDAFLTLTLMAHGANEVNPLMQYLLQSHPQLFAAVKMALTGAGVLILVACARAKVFRIVRVGVIMHWFLLAYLSLIGYEWWLLEELE